jgi:hypothetical protein
MTVLCPGGGLLTRGLTVYDRCGYRSHVTTIGPGDVGGFFSFWDEHVRPALA